MNKTKSAEKQHEKEYPPLVLKMLELRTINKSIARHEDTIKRLEAQKYRCTSHLSFTPRGGVKMDWSDIDHEIQVQQQLLIDERREYARIANEIADSPEAALLDYDEYQILMLRYADGKKLREVAEQLHMGTTTAYVKETSAFAKIGNERNKTEKN